MNAAHWELVNMSASNATIRLESGSLLGVAPKASGVLSLLSSFGYETTKRTLDVVGAIVLLAALAPVMAIIALLVRATSNGPVIFKQVRLTKGGKSFTMYKFRSMKVDAERHSGAVWASKNDSRVTKVGKILRRTRLDELPQLLNVLSGEMSLIGPRPERPEIAEELSKELPGFDKRLQVKAGITGLAQVSSGYASSKESYAKKLAYDLNYVRKRSLTLDAVIAVKTVAVVITGTGAQ